MGRGLTKSSFVVAFAGINLGPSFMIKKIITPQRAKEGTCGSSSGCYDAYMLSRRKVLNNTRLLEMGFAGGGYRMFGLLMLPLLTQKQHSRIFEIGLGPCNLSPGASILVWQSLLPNAKLWVADYNANCVERLQTGDGMIYGARALIGDQSNRTDLRRWVHETGGRFDAIIDDVNACISVVLLTLLTPHDSLPDFSTRLVQLMCCAGWPQQQADSHLIRRTLAHSRARWSVSYRGPWCGLVACVRRQWRTLRQFCYASVER